MSVGQGEEQGLEPRRPGQGNGWQRHRDKSTEERGQDRPVEVQHEDAARKVKDAFK